MSWLSNFWNWLKVDPSRESKDMQNKVNNAGGKGTSPGTDTTVPSYIDQVSGMLPTIATDLEWVLIALVGLLAYVFIFKK